MEFLVQHGKQSHGDNSKTGFFLHFLDNDFFRRKTDVRPTAGKRPSPVNSFSDEQNPVFLEYRAANVNFWGGIPAFSGKQGLNFLRLNLRVTGQNVHAELAKHFKTLKVVHIFRIGQPGLTNRLDLLRPFQP
ncbi:hypothetical protein D3C74_262550 [compost metagenome]